MDPILQGSYWVFPDGTRLPAISGAQDLPNVDIPDPQSLVDAFNVDFVLNVGGDPLDVGGGVPYGDPEAAGYVGLSDAVRSGLSGDQYIGSVATNSSLSDILRSYGDEGTVAGPAGGGGYVATDYGTSPAGSDVKITDVFDIITKSLSTAAGIAFAGLAASKAGTSNPGAPSGSAGASPSLAQRLFGGYLPGASGNPITQSSSSMAFILMAVLGGLLIFFLARSR